MASTRRTEYPHHRAIADGQTPARTCSPRLLTIRAIWGRSGNP
jgi:hypothetical protein